MNLLFVVSEQEEIINALSNSSLLLNETEIKKSGLYDPSKTKIISKNIIPAKKFKINVTHYFEHTIDFKFHKGCRNLSIFCATALNA